MTMVKGGHLNEEVKAKLSLRMKAIVKTEEYKKKMRMIRSRIHRKCLPKYLKRKGMK